MYIYIYCIYVHVHVLYIHVHVYVNVFLQKASRNSDLAVFISPFDLITKIVVSGTRPKPPNIL